MTRIYFENTSNANTYLIDKANGWIIEKVSITFQPLMRIRNHGLPSDKRPTAKFRNGLNYQIQVQGVARIISIRQFTDAFFKNTSAGVLTFSLDWVATVYITKNADGEEEEYHLDKCLIEEFRADALNEADDEGFFLARFTLTLKEVRT